MSNFRNWFNEQSEEVQEQFLGEYLQLRLKSKEYEKLCKLLANYYFIEAKINHPLFGVQALIEDYDLLQDETLLTEFPEDGKISSLKKIQGALRLSAHIINRDSQQLPAQLTGRLLHFHTPEINNLLQQLPTDQGLRCLIPSLTPPGSPLIRTLSGHSSSVNAIALTPDGKNVISGSLDKTIKIWDLVTGQEKFTLEGHSDSVNAIAVTPDAKTLISRSGDNTIKIWDLGTGREKFTLEGHSDSVNAIAVTPDAKTLISRSGDNTIKIWDIATAKEIATFTGESPITCRLVASDGVTIVAGERSGRLQFLRLQGKVTDE